MFHHRIVRPISGHKPMLRTLTVLLSGAALAISLNAPASALSELRPANGGPPVPVQSETPALIPDHATPPAETTPSSDEMEPDEGIDGGDVVAPGLPDPDPLINRPDGQAQDAAPENPAAEDDSAEILFDINAAPEPVRRLRGLIVEAAASGDITRLRPLLNPGPNQTQLLAGSDDKDPVDLLKSMSGDDDGMEILAILLDVLSSGFARVDAGTPDEMYVWPYFAEKQLSLLTPPEKVELLRIVTAGDLEGMMEFGNYSFFRVGISPSGEWKFFTAGD